MSNINDFLNYLTNLPQVERGKVFEVYCKWFLENDPIYASQIKRVWLWKDWPGNWGRDKGIDIIAETHRGEFWAIQAKCYDKNYYVTKEDVDKFLSESSRANIAYRLLICTTDLLGDNAREVIAGQEKQVGICSLENLLNSSLEWPTSVENLKPQPIRQPKTPRPHQEKAISAVLQGFKNHEKGQLYMACGTGKTLVGLWLAEQLKSHHTLVLVPSISLVSQLYQEWVANSTTSFIPIFVCSDPTVNEKDQRVTSLYELGFPTTTDPGEILSYFSSSQGIPKVIFSTYHSSPVIKKVCALDESLMFDLTVADEAHRCTGAANSDFATIFEPNAIRTRHKLFMTATPKIFSDHVKTKAKELEYEILSMDDDKKFGPVFYKLPFSEAISQDLLSDYEVLISVMDNATYREYAEKGRFIAIDNHETDARTVASQLLVSKAIKDHNLQRIITFHNRKSAAHDFINTFPKAIKLISQDQQPNIGFYGIILGEMQQSKRKSFLKLFESLENGHAGVLANVRCLSEGVDVPTLDGVAFIDPKGSEIEIVQAVGRAIRKAPNKKKGLIILPVFIDANEDPEINLEESCFKPIWKVLNALRAHDDILAEELDNLRLELGRRTYKKPPKLSKVTIDLPVSIGIAFSESLQLKIIETTSASWFYFLGLLQNFKEKHGHTNVPSTYEENPSLATWVIAQRVKYRQNSIPKERAEKLESLGFIWDPIDKAWEEMFNELCKFKKDKGHCNVPEIYSDKLCSWVGIQRSYFKQNKLSKDKAEKLNSLSFDWNPFDSAWQEMFYALCEFKQNTGHLDVWEASIRNEKLCTWTQKQRQNYRNNKLSKDYIEKLNEIEFVWDPLIAAWEAMFLEICKYKEEHGHCNVKQKYPQNPKLATWVNTQRAQYKEGEYLPERQKRLEEIGFIWDTNISAWETQFLALSQFKERQGHCNVPQRHNENSKLTTWVGTQRTDYKDKRITQERIARLESIGFQWNPSETAWEMMFTLLCEYRKENGDCNVPPKHKDKQLSSWVAHQRTAFKENTLDNQRINRLKEIGFILDPRRSLWNELYDELSNFKNKHGHCNVPKEYPENKRLGGWVANQRTKNSKNKLASDRIDKLNQLGFSWNTLISSWEDMFTALKEFQKTNGYCNVPKDSKQYPKLGIWVSVQRKEYKNNNLSEERLQKLNEINFDWNPSDNLWNYMYNELVNFKNTNGHFIISRNNKSTQKLASWTSIQRREYKKGKLSQERTQRLNALGFIWNAK